MMKNDVCECSIDNSISGRLVRILDKLDPMDAKLNKLISITQKEAKLIIDRDGMSNDVTIMLREYENGWITKETFIERLYRKIDENSNVVVIDKNMILGNEQL